MFIYFFFKIKGFYFFLKEYLLIIFCEVYVCNFIKKLKCYNILYSRIYVIIFYFYLRGEGGGVKILKL